MDATGLIEGDLPGGRSLQESVAAAAGHRPSSRITPAEFGSLVAKFYDVPAGVSSRQRAVRAVRTVLQADSAVLLPAAGEDMRHAVIDGAVENKHAALRAALRALAPVVVLRGGGAATPDEVLGRSQWLRSDLYQAHFRPLGLRHLLRVETGATEGPGLRLWLARRSRRPAFSRCEIALGTMLLQHLHRAFSFLSREDRLAGERELFSGAISRMPMGLVKLDRSGRVLYRNEEAGRILDERDGLRQTGLRLRADHPAQNVALQRITAAAGRERQAREAADVLKISRPSGRTPLHLRMLPIEGRGLLGLPGEPQAVVYLRDPEAHPLRASSTLQKLFDFTRMETAVALALVEGMTLETAAASLGVTRNTVRTHLRSAFRKCGVGRQTMLVRVLLGTVVAPG